MDVSRTKPNRSPHPHTTYDDRAPWATSECPQRPQPPTGSAGEPVPLHRSQIGFNSRVGLQTPATPDKCVHTASSTACLNTPPFPVDWLLEPAAPPAVAHDRTVPSRRAGDRSEIAAPPGRGALGQTYRESDCASDHHTPAEMPHEAESPGQAAHFGHAARPSMRLRRHSTRDATTAERITTGPVPRGGGQRSHAALAASGPQVNTAMGPSPAPTATRPCAKPPAQRPRVSRAATAARLACVLAGVLQCASVALASAPQIHTLAGR